MSYTKTVWKDLPDTTTPITADRLNNIENGVEYLFENSEAGIEIKNEYSNLQNSVYSCNYVNNINTYSNDEIRVGTWIDGKPIYRKTVNTGTLPSAGGKVINHNISNIDYVTKIIGTAYRNTDNIFLPLPHATYDNTAISCYCDKTAITIIVYTDRSAFQKSCVTLEYTKTTDVGTVEITPIDDIGGGAN